MAASAGAISVSSLPNADKHGLPGGSRFVKGELDSEWEALGSGCD